jgi:hypothetical protein
MAKVDEFTFDFVNFKDIPEKGEKVKKFDKMTTETYVAKRRLQRCALVDKEIPHGCMFSFKYMWNPINGERCGIDKVGPLYFNVIELYNHYYNNRYNGLWTPSSYDPVLKQSYEGYYGDLVGSGKDIKINSRGFHPDKYLFRLPIHDCYLYEDHNHSVVTMGPLLTNEEITEIDKIILNLPQQHKHYVKSYSTLSAMKAMYDNALDENPTVDKLDTWVNNNINSNKNQLVKDVCKWWNDGISNKNRPDYTNEPLFTMLKDFYNRSYVDKLVLLHPKAT